MSRTYRKSNSEYGFRKKRIDDLILRYENDELFNHEKTYYQSILNSKNFKQALLKKYHISDGRGYINYSRNPGWWNHLYQETKIRAITQNRLRKIHFLVDLDDAPIIPEKVYVPYYW